MLKGEELREGRYSSVATSDDRTIMPNNLGARSSTWMSMEKLNRTEPQEIKDKHMKHLFVYNSVHEHNVLVSPTNTLLEYSHTEQMKNIICKIQVVEVT